MSEQHGFTDATSDTPEICRCGAAFVEGYHLNIVKLAHLAAVGTTTEEETSS